MANGTSSSRAQRTLSVNLGQDLFRRLNSVVDLLRMREGTNQTEFVKQTLDEKIRVYEDRYKSELAELAKLKEKLLQHSESGATMEQDENRQGTVRRSSSQNADEDAKEDRKDKSRKKPRKS